MTYGTVEDLIVVERYFPDSALLEVLANPPAGVFDARSWSYWRRDACFLRIELLARPASLFCRREPS